MRCTALYPGKERSGAKQRAVTSHASILPRVLATFRDWRLLPEDERVSSVTLENLAADLAAFCTPPTPTFTSRVMVPLIWIPGPVLHDEARPFRTRGARHNPAATAVHEDAENTAPTHKSHTSASHPRLTPIHAQISHIRLAPTTHLNPLPPPRSLNLVLLTPSLPPRHLSNKTNPPHGPSRSPEASSSANLAESCWARAILRLINPDPSSKSSYLDQATLPQPTSTAIVSRFLVPLRFATSSPPSSRGP
ncbi:hypothetical protein C8R46DRAFT_1214985 [Mycena filopes]|nr:hypothetical protein C8R46DRAFT_1214985 [Mycena filopes]